MIKKYFAKINENNVVTFVDVVNLEDDATEEDGINFLKNFYNNPNLVWKMTDKKTTGNVHADGETPFRGNYAEVDGTWDSVNNVFWPRKPFDSYVKDNSNYIWKAPVEYPSVAQNEDGHLYYIFWNEENLRWHAWLCDLGSDTPNEATTYYWNPDNSTWNTI